MYNLDVIGCDRVIFCFFKQKTAYEMRISDWSSDVCSSDLCAVAGLPSAARFSMPRAARSIFSSAEASHSGWPQISAPARSAAYSRVREIAIRSEEHTSELQSLMRISSAVFCLKKKTVLVSH